MTILKMTKSRNALVQTFLKFVQQLALTQAIWSYYNLIIVNTEHQILHRIVLKILRDSHLVVDGCINA
jgi:hypothetical protein